jgi:hypothetical protein
LATLAGNLSLVLLYPAMVWVAGLLTSINVIDRDSVGNPWFLAISTAPSIIVCNSLLGAKLGGVFDIINDGLIGFVCRGRNGNILSLGLRFCGWK